MNSRKRRSNPLRILILVVLVAAALYFDQVVVPTVPPLFVPTPTPTRSPESYLTEAQTLENEGKYAQALTTYNEAIRVDPKNAGIYISMARLEIYRGNYADAVTNAENALLINSNNAMAHALRGWALGLQGDYLQGEAAVKQAIEIDPNNASAYAYWAEILVSQNLAGQGSLTTLDNAIEASRKAQALAPDAIDTHRARGLVLEVTANYAEAAQEFEAAVALNSNIPDLHLSLGRNYRYLDQLDKAIDEFNRALALNPSDPLAATYISKTYARAGEFARAIQFAQTALKSAPADPYMWGNLGIMQYSNLNLEDAVDSLRLAVQGGMTPEGQEVSGIPLDYNLNVMEYYYKYGLALAKLGRCSEAIPISQALQTTVRNDEVAVYNAQEMVNICQQVATGGQPTAAASETPAGEEQVTPTP